METTKRGFLKLSKIKWENRAEKEKEKQEREKFKNKEFKKLSQKEKDELLEKIARQLGYL